MSAEGFFREASGKTLKAQERASGDLFEISKGLYKALGD